MTKNKKSKHIYQERNYDRPYYTHRPGDLERMVVRRQLIGLGMGVLETLANKLTQKLEETK